MAGLERLRFLAADEPTDEGPARPAGAFRGDAGASGVQVGPFTSDEGAARFYLDELLTADGRPTMRSVAAPEEPARAAGLAVESAQELPATNTRLVRFSQHQDEIPVFGGQAVVELDGERALVSADVRVGQVPDVGRVPSVEPAEAVDRVASFIEADVELGQVPPPSLTYFHDEDADEWHLAWLVRSVPGLPSEARLDADDPRAGHGIGQVFRARHQETDYLVDAHDGDILFYYGTVPTMAAIPVKCKGEDEDGNAVEFFGSQGQGTFVLDDPLRRVRTLDFELGDIDADPMPTDSVASATATFGDEHRGAVTAHVHGAIVQDYFKRVLQRDGIDDKGMELISIVNTTYADQQPPPVWVNAAWWKGRMWYGQSKDSQGRLVSMARFLDVIAHELTHGVTATTSGLLYQGQSGALNESYSDVFGVIIANSHRAPTPGDVTTWDWRIGPGLGPGGDPLRHFADPTSVGDPDHMDQFLVTTADHGGVHTNSNIHNKAVHVLLSAVDAQGDPVLSVDDVATIMYLALVRLPKLAKFTDAREKAVEVAKVMFSGDAQRSAQVVGTIEAAYTSVGIN